MFAILKNPTFARLFAAQVVALLGTGLLTVALGLLAYDLAGSRAGAVLGTALAVKMFAYVAVAPVISAVTYRVSRRILLIGSNIVRASIAVLLPLVGQTWQIYVLIFALQAASATFTPAFQSVIPAVLVDEDDYTKGLSLSRLAYDLESLLSPVIAAALLAVMAYNYLFIGTVAGFAVSAALVLTTTLPAIAGDKSSESFWQRTTSGARVMLDRPVLRALLALNMVVAAATGLVIVNTVVYVHDMLGSTNTALALLLACYGGGSMVIAVALPRVLHAIADRWVMLTGATVIPVVLAATAGLLVLHPSPAVGWAGFITAWILLGAATSLINTPSARLLRYQSAPDALPSVFTAQFSLSHACFFLTYLLAGWLGVAVGQPAAAATLAVLAAFAAILAARIWPAKHATISDPHRTPAAAHR
ncbi:MFS transporter [Mycolicibacterium fallax]|uniref:MFS transporter n=1 Tax=Mycolicibacterium fallax TaxID=1793 RepID=A0A1X1R8C0_MYCFA|nr:MFS transporter [Mycolicibacterium fallax]ORV01124.1 MFS transporter [Mycolicibacterium fallax]HOW93873.1 MFS transporter [Mycolicibacterium fallax]HSA40617.1 MFS transporter [Mycobacterium sp.]